MALQSINRLQKWQIVGLRMAHDQLYRVPVQFLEQSSSGVLVMFAAWNVRWVDMELLEPVTLAETGEFASSQRVGANSDRTAGAR